MLWTEAELGDSPDDILDVIVAEVKLSNEIMRADLATMVYHAMKMRE